MTAYIIVNYNITDPDKFGEYLAVAPGALKVGEVSVPLVLDSESETLEGTPGHQTVMLQYESAEAARSVWESGEYRAVIGLRHDATDNHFAVMVKGL